MNALTMLPYRPLHGVRLLGTDNWPQTLVGWAEERHAGHPMVQWLARQLGRVGIPLEPDIIIKRPVYRDCDMIMVNEHLGGPAVMGSHKQIAALITAAVHEHRPVRVP